MCWLRNALLRKDGQQDEIDEANVNPNANFANVSIFHQFALDLALRRLGLTRFGTRQPFDFIAKIKDGTLNDNVVTTGCTISKQSLCANYSASVAWIVC